MEEQENKKIRMQKFFISRYLSSALATTITHQQLAALAAHTAAIGSLVSTLLLALTTYTSTTQQPCSRRMTTIVASGSQFVVCQL